MAKGMGNMLKQAQKLQAKIFKLQEEMADRTVVVEPGYPVITGLRNDTPIRP